MAPRASIGNYSAFGISAVSVIAKSHVAATAREAANGIPLRTGQEMLREKSIALRNAGASLRNMKAPNRYDDVSAAQKGETRRYSSRNQPHCGEHGPFVRKEDSECTPDARATCPTRLRVGNGRAGRWSRTWLVVAAGRGDTRVAG